MKLTGKHYFLIGKMAGILLAIAQRLDIPEEVKKNCKCAYEDYKVLFDKEEENE
jgi:hypothetical protein